MVIVNVLNLFPSNILKFSNTSEPIRIIIDLYSNIVDIYVWTTIS